MSEQTKRGVLGAPLSTDNLSVLSIIGAALRPIVALDRTPTRLSVVTMWGRLTLEDLDAQLNRHGWAGGDGRSARIGRLALRWSGRLRSVRQQRAEPIAAE